MIRRTVIVAAAFALASAAPSRAGIERAGTTAANFLQVGTGAASLGMGGAALGLAGGDLGSITWNAASLAQLRETQIAFSHVGLAQSSAQEWAAVAGRMQGVPFGWAFSGLYQGDGSFEGRDALGNSTGSFSASSMAFAANGAYTVMEKVSLGLGLRYVSETLGDVRGSGLALDLGVHVQQGRYGFGAAMQNTGGKMNYAGAKYPFCASMGVGASMIDPATGLKLAVDLNVPNAYYPDMRAGVEWMYQNRFALRTGYRYEIGAEAGEPIGGPTFGLGAGANGFWFDYALLAGGTGSEGQHRVALSYRPGTMGLGGMGSVGAATPATNPAPRVREAKVPKASEPVAKAEKKKEPKAEKIAKAEKPKKSKSSKTAEKPATVVVVPPVVVPPVTTAPAPAAAKSAPAPEPVAVQPTKAPVSPASDPIALDTAPPREAKMSETPRSMPAAARRAEAANVPSSTTTAAKQLETPKTMPFVVPPPAAPKSEPAVTKPAETKTETSPAEAPKPAAETRAPETAAVTPAVTPAETPKPVETPATPVVETPKPVEKQPEPTKAEPVKTEPVKVAPVKAEPAKPAIPRPAEITVKKGDTLESLAVEWGTSPAAIMMENNLITQKPPKPGTKLKLPPKSR